MRNHSMMNQAPTLECVCDPGLQPPVLEDVSLKAVLEDLMAQVEVRQVYANRERAAIEAVYTFPVPRGAVLLSFTARLGGRELVGRMLPALQAEAMYEDAVAGGDGAILLQEVSPGLHTVNVGNLLPGETAELTYRYAQLQYWQGGTLRFALPTVVAPRYGDPGAAGLQPHQAPKSDIFTVREASFRASIRGALQEAEITSRTHSIVVERRDGQAVVSFDERDRRPMDRDIVLHLRREGAAPALAVAEPAADGDGRFVLLSCCPDEARPVSPEGRYIKILVDCSGSMNGDSIAQARAALRRILDSLRPQDHFAIAVFGSTWRFVTGECVAATPAAVSAARQAVATIRADLGGTELGAALLPILRRRDAGGRQGDVLLVTDGELYDDGVVQQARRAGGRVFAVGVGCAPGESLLGSLAEITGGAAEFVTPGDDVAARIHRHFLRLLRPRVASLSVRWPGRAEGERRDREGGIFAGDTLHIMARVRGEPAAGGQVVVDCALEDGSRTSTAVPLRTLEDQGGAVPAAGLLERLRASAELRTAALLEDDLAPAERDRLAALAVRCRLLSPWTSCVMVADRGEEELTDGMPGLRKVAQMPAAGWGGLGRMAFLNCDAHFKILPALAGPPQPDYCIERLPSLFPLGSAGDAARPAGDWTCERLAGLGVPEAVIDRLRDLVDGGEDEQLVCLVCLRVLLDGGGARGLGRDDARQVRRAIRKGDRALAGLRQQVQAIIDAHGGARP